MLLGGVRCPSAARGRQRGSTPTGTPQYGTYYGALLQIAREGSPGGTIVFVWRRVDGEWRLVAYRSVE